MWTLDCAHGSGENPCAVLLDVDGTLLDTLPNLRRVWTSWALKHDLDVELVWQTALVNRPLETFAMVAPELDFAQCLEALHEIEDEDAQNGDYSAYDGADELLTALRPDSWAIVTGNYAHRVRIRFERLGLPLPQVIVDAGTVSRGKPHPEGYMLAAKALGCRPEECLALEDGESGIAAARRAAPSLTGSTTSSHTGSPSKPKHSSPCSSPNYKSTAAMRSCLPTASARQWFAHRQVQWS